MMARGISRLYRLHCLQPYNELDEPRAVRSSIAPASWINAKLTLQKPYADSDFAAKMNFAVTTHRAQRDSSASSLR